MEYLKELQFNKYNDIDFNNPEIVNTIACNAIKKLDYKNARDLFQLNATINPSEQSLNNLGNFYLYSMHEPEQAIKILSDLINQNPKTHFPYSLLGISYLKIGNYEAAIPCLLNALKINENYTDLINLGAAYYCINNYKVADYYFQKAYSMRSDDVSSLSSFLSHGFCQYGLGNYIQAKKVADFMVRLEDLDSDDNFLPSDIANLFYCLEDYEKTVEVFEDMIGVYEYAMMPDYFEKIIYSLMKLERNDEGEKLLNQILCDLDDEIQDLEEADEKWADRINDYLEEKNSYKKIYSEITKGYKPIVRFYPGITFECRMFGCVVHNTKYI